MVKIKIVSNNPDFSLPEYQTSGSSGMDLQADIQNDIILRPMERKLIPSGISVEIPEKYEAQVRPRSGLAIKHGVTVLNTPGTIDSDYRGEIKVILINLSDSDFIVEPGMRIAQLVFNPVFKPEIKIVSEITRTDRNSGGFGHTGY